MTNIGRTAVAIGWMLVVCVPFWSAAQSAQPPLAEVARREAERRKTSERATKVYTNADVKGGRPLTTSRAEPAPPGAPSEAEGQADAASAEQPSEADVERLATLRDDLARKRAELDRLKGWIDTLNTRIGESFDAVERETLTRDRDATLAEYARAEQELQAQSSLMIELAAKVKPRPAQTPRP